MGIFSVTTLWKPGLFVLGFLKYTTVLYILVIHSENVIITSGREVEVLWVVKEVICDQIKFKVGLIWETTQVWYKRFGSVSFS